MGGGGEKLKLVCFNLMIEMNERRKQNLIFDEVKRNFFPNELKLFMLKAHKLDPANENVKRFFMKLTINK